MNELPIKDIPYDYEYDVITCYEHPLFAAIEYYEHGAGRYYALLSKFYGIYCSGNVRKQVMSEMREILGVEVKNLEKNNYKMLKKYVEEGMPVLMGVNLKDIFYSSYYLEKDWVHWMLIKGYKDKGNMITVLDNTQYEYIGHSYGEFHIPFKMLNKANGSYRKKFGHEYSLMSVRKCAYISPKDTYQRIMEKYLSINLEETNNYRQITILETYEKILLSGMLGGEILLEFEKKLININKYRQLFFDEIKEEMLKYQYNDVEVKQYEQEVGKLSKKWQEYILKSLLKLKRGTENELKLDSEIISLECLIQRMVTLFLEYIKKEHVKKIQSNILYKYILENDEDQLIRVKEEDIEFCFNGKKIYNWWDVDNAPKVIVYKQDVQRKRKINFETILKSKMLVHETEKTLYEAGIFIRNKDTGGSIIMGIENNNYAVVDIVGIVGYKYDIKKQNEYHLFLEIDKGKIKMGLYEEKNKKVLWEQEEFVRMDIGVTCKTWGNPGRVEVVFSRICIEKNVV